MSDHTTATVEGVGTTADVDGTNPIAVTCRGDGDPQPQVTWSKVGGDINATHAQISGAEMQLTCSPSAIGLYACNATNERGSDVAYFACEYDQRSRCVEIHLHISTHTLTYQHTYTDISAHIHLDIHQHTYTDISAHIHLDIQQHTYTSISAHITNIH